MKKFGIILASFCLAFTTFLLVACGGIAGKYTATDSISVGSFSTSTSYTLEMKNDGTFTYTIESDSSSSTVSGKWEKDEEKENTYYLKTNSLQGNGTLVVVDGSTVKFNGREMKK